MRLLSSASTAGDGSLSASHRYSGSLSGNTQQLPADVEFELEGWDIYRNNEWV